MDIRRVGKYTGFQESVVRNPKTRIRLIVVTFREGIKN